MGILQQAFHKGLQIVEPQHVGRIAQPLVGIGMHFEKETVGPERLGRMRHGGHKFAVAARLAARRAGALHRVGAMSKPSAASSAIGIRAMSKVIRLSCAV